MLAMIWIIQLLVYPSFLRVEAAHFFDFHLRHSRFMGWLVGPAMVVELCVAGLLCVLFPGFLTACQLLIVISLWSLTFFVSVPIHRQLSRQQDFTSIHRLIHTNWPRTILWSLKAVLAVYLLVHWIVSTS